MLLETAIEATRDTGHEVLWLGVWEHNPDAVAFYERFGFTTVGNKVFMMGTDTQSDYIMRLRISTRLP
jgi:ribosomal protein S18 acetylase RimI-like enzyme